jgi:hypothetical protein
MAKRTKFIVFAVGLVVLRVIASAELRFVFYWMVKLFHCIMGVLTQISIWTRA